MVFDTSLALWRRMALRVSNKNCDRNTARSLVLLLLLLIYWFLNTLTGQLSICLIEAKISTSCSYVHTCYIILKNSFWTEQTVKPLKFECLARHLVRWLTSPWVILHYGLNVHRLWESKLSAALMIRKLSKICVI